MHEIGPVEGDTDIRGHDWIKDRENSNRYVRLNGYRGAPTAELVETAIGWVGQTWMLAPPRTTVLSPDMSLGWAIHLLECAETQGHDAAIWTAIPQPPRCLGTPNSSPGEARCWTSVKNGRSITIIEARGNMGVPHYLVAIDRVLMTGRSGKPLIYDELDDALYDTDMELGAWLTV